MTQPTTSTLDVIDTLAVHRFPKGPLEDYLVENIDGFKRPLTVQQFQGGMSNPTFLLTSGEGHTYVMRKKPPGELMPSAHAVDREFRVITALGPTDMPVPKTYVLCEDESIVGTAFYVMEHVQGRVFINNRLPDVSVSERTHIFDSMNQALATLHMVDYQTVGLEGFGREGGYSTRQIKRWSQQYVNAKTNAIPTMDNLIEWLPANIPADDSTTIAHGDFRLGNIIFHPREPRVIAVLDWELSTLGHPFADLAYNCLAYHAGDPARGDLIDCDLDALGIPREADYVDAYGQRTGRDAHKDWTFFLVLSLFRLAAITQGVYFRGVQGNASDPSALERKGNCERLANTAWSLVEAQRG
jgi:aminoglycoside phosphotransferase (APT) family kinase protein